MSAQVSAPRAARRRGVLSAAVGFLVEPAEPPDEAEAPAWAVGARPAVAVVGLGPGCGTTTVARALGAELALRDRDAATIVSAESVAEGGIPLGTQAAGRLSRALARQTPVRTRPVGRLCLTACDVGEAASLESASRELAPLVLDVADARHAALAVSVVDAVVLVGGPGAEPALAAVLADSLRRVGPDPVVALNRDRGDAERWEGRCSVRLPDSRMGARLALAGREPRGELGRAVALLADLVASA